MAEIDVNQLAVQLAEAVRASLKGDLDDIKNRLDRVESRLDQVETSLKKVGNEVKDAHTAIISLGHDVRKQERVTNNLILDVYRLKSEEEQQ
ncbi:hypothetical protein [Thermoactinomyces sp. CICC 10522]|uniref:hypothetical protein n=1 Tax=Thermoactinomyces sp. CICC 10522 TaxID=2767427 RepID=UPI0018DC5560|nr:hypothetical protein [Thermoactinomyces sp. CICC 10522]MBH8605616.1 hypothetical protein [Thermoactinomyces sp. CICC 10522]